MSRRILIIQGHPDCHSEHLCHQLARHYQQAAETAGHDVRLLQPGRLTFPLLRSSAEWKESEPCDDIRLAQQQVSWSEHLVIIYPLWMGSMPALLKGFLEQVLRPGFAFHYGPNMSWKKALKGKSSRVIVTMGMPALVYRVFYRAHSLKALVRNLLAFTGIGPNRTTVLGMVEGMSERRYQRCLSKLAALARRGR